MKKNIELTEDAKNDLKEATEWYEDKKEGLGEEFLNEVEKTFQTIELNPLQNQKVRGNIRRALVKRFSFGVFYIVKNIKIIINRVVHTSRNPKEWK